MKTSIYSPLLFLASVLLIALLPLSTHAQNACPADAFQDVQPDPANSAYPDPELSVTCNDDSFTVQSNGIPNYEFVAVTPGNLSAQNNNWSIPLTPTGAREEVPLLGTAAVLVNGVQIFGPNEGGNLGYGDPYLDDILDFCSGHVGPSGYHNHAPPLCIFDEYVDNVGLVVGYSFDGWPILAPYECVDDACTTIVELQSSWQLTDESITAAWDKHSYIEGSGDLDECNGKAQADGSYAYYATATFPYFLGCYVNSEFEAVEVMEPTAEPIIIPTEAPTETPTSTTTALYGDVNCDGTSSLIDVVLIQRYNTSLLDSTENCADAMDNQAVYLAACDVNGDGVCSLVDAIIILQCNAFIPNPYCDVLETEIPLD